MSITTPWWRSERTKAAILSLLILGVILAVWHLATLPKASVAANLTPEQLEEVESFLAAIDANDDVQNVFSNFDIPESVQAELDADD